MQISSDLRQRRTLRVLLATALVATLAACGPGSAEPVAAPAVVAQDSTVRVVASDLSVPFGSPAEISFRLSSAAGAAIAAGSASVKIGGHTVPVKANDAGLGSITVPADQLSTGKQTVTVSFPGDETHKPATGSVAISVEPAAAALTLTLTPAESGATGAVAAVTGPTGVAVAGSVSFALDGTPLTGGGLASGSAAAEIPAGLMVGDHQVSATFTPQDPAQLAPVSTAATLSITKALSSVIATAHEESVRYGDKGYFNLAVTPIGALPGTDLTGAVSVLDAGTAVVEGTTDASGVASLEFMNTADPGSKTYTVSYAGNDGVTGSQADFVVQTAQTNVDIGIKKPKLKSGESGSVLVSVVGSPDKPTGTAVVTFDGVEIANGALDENGTISAPVSAVTAGSHSIEVSYGGDIRFEANTATATLTVKEPIVNPNADKAAAINADNPCPAAAVACVDLSNQRAWMQDGGQVSYGPVSITSGRKGYRTPAGTFAAYWFDKNHKSSLYEDAPMPNSVFFNNDVAFHAGSLSVQSHGCIHLSNSASATFFNNLAVGDQVYVFGSAPY